MKMGGERYTAGWACREEIGHAIDNVKRTSGTCRKAKWVEWKGRPFAWAIPGRQPSAGLSPGHPAQGLGQGPCPKGVPGLG